MLMNAFRRLRRLVHSPRSPAGAEPRVDPDKIRRLAEDLLQDSATIWADDRHQVRDAIVKAEQAWALHRSPETAIQLGVMYDRVNRHQDSLTVYRRAFHEFPAHPRLRHEAGITLLRHGTPEDTRAFFESLRRLDPGDEFTRFYFELADRFEGWAQSLAEAIGNPAGDSVPYLVVCPVWGAAFARDFIELYCASLLSPNNLPSLAKEHPTHFVVFCPPDVEEYLKQAPTFQAVSRYATVHFMNYPDELVNYGTRMDAHYGSDLGPYYRRTCKFLLMSTAHYSSLRAARLIGGCVLPLGADVLLSDGSMTEIARVMKAGADVVLVTGIRLGQEVRTILERRHRNPDGSLHISAAETAELYVGHMPESFFVDSTHFSSMPVYFCWKVDGAGVLVHSTHYHPICIRASATSHPYAISIDPVDSRFMSRARFAPDRLHIVQDCSISVFGVEEDPLMGHDDSAPNVMVPKDVGLWLSAFWGELRPTYLRLPIRFDIGSPSDAWDKAEADALHTVEEILSVAQALEDVNRPHKSWRLDAKSPPENGKAAS